MTDEIGPESALGGPSLRLMRQIMDGSVDDPTERRKAIRALKGPGKLDAAIRAYPARDDDERAVLADLADTAARLVADDAAHRRTQAETVRRRVIEALEDGWTVDWSGTPGDRWAITCTADPRAERLDVTVGYPLADQCRITD